MQKKLAMGSMYITAILLCLGMGISASWGMASRPPLIGSPAPRFQLSSLAGVEGSLDQYRGKVVLLNFWATWCQPCTKEMPAMQAAHDALRDQGFVVLAINELEDIQKVRDHIQEHQHTFAVLLDPDNHVANQYGVVGLPVSIFIDKTGHVRKIVKGGLLTEQSILETVQPLLQETTVSRKFAPVP
jgi:peroxiredoxin